MVAMFFHVNPTLWSTTVLHNNIYIYIICRFSVDPGFRIVAKCLVSRHKVMIIAIKDVPKLVLLYSSSLFQSI